MDDEAAKMSSSREDNKQQFILWQPSRFSSSAKTTLKRHVSWQGASLRSLSALFGRVNAKALLGVSALPIQYDSEHSTKDL